VLIQTKYHVKQMNASDDPREAIPQPQDDVRILGYVAVTTELA
jgi:hypothetical protein